MKKITVGNMTSTVIVYGAAGAVGSHTAWLLDHQNRKFHLAGRDQDKFENLGQD